MGNTKVFEEASRQRRSRPAAPRVTGRHSFEKLTPHQRESRHRAFDAIAAMRNWDMSVTAAAKHVGTTPANVRYWAGGALEKSGSRYRATRADRLYHRMAVLSANGLADVDTRGSRVRSLVGRHWNAVRRFGVTGDVSLLLPFVSKRAGGVELASDPAQIEEYFRRGEVSVDDIYI